MTEGATRIPVLAFRGGRFVAIERAVPAECAVAISVNGSTHAVMMATPRDVEDLGIGLALNEGIVAGLDEIARLEVVETELGLDCRIWLSEERSQTYTARRRQMAGPVGCGICGVESLALAARELPVVADDLTIAPEAIVAAVAAMACEQSLGRATRAVHAAAFHREGTVRQVLTREDVGRHNALDKVAGALAQQGVDPASGFLTITSRLSVELIQKAAMMGCGLIAAVSVPSALAVAEAEAAGITLVAVVRGDEFEIFTHPGRVVGAFSSVHEETSHAA
ncbi:sulfurtransferase FdhD [Aureimonas sp. SA4125]|uniref:formate dehydrogenase accessory sulfurtransferase FdhD n=1 Tax=Aureimonas sp. SA4125 TaxID=2826993 RepID=UPI001CC342F0|nr:formate dehydrogenase accessory sulfurtransferase FdhD [Aureimonas sp. SA4125]BDA83289.1 sulfurtransferase FdhD [Aureimonas sp. SA4125]